MSVDTNVTGRNLEPYRRLPDGDLVVLITPELAAMAEALVVERGGLLGRKLTVGFVAPDTCADDGPTRSRRTGRRQR